MTALKLLKAARKTLSKPSAWTRGAFARTCLQIPTTESDPEATCFCLGGAINEAVYGYWLVGGPADGVEEARCFIRHAIDEHTESFMEIPVFNDHPNTTHEDILAVLDSAIRRASK